MGIVQTTAKMIVGIVVCTQALVWSPSIVGLNGSALGAVAETDNLTWRLGVPALPFLHTSVAGPDEVDSLRIHILDGHEPDDVLTATFTDPRVSSHFDPSEGVLTLSGRAPRSLYQGIVEGVEFVGHTSANEQRSFLVLSAPSMYLADSGNVYEYVYVGENISWTDASDDAESRSFGPYGGHLATVSSKVENDIVSAGIRGNTWIGGTDSAVEGDFSWAAGPRNHPTFWSGGPTGSSPGDQFSRWAEGEPNNLNGNEDYVHIYASTGEWNDFPNNGHGTDDEGRWADGTTDQGEHVTGYVVEYEIADIASVALTIDLTRGIAPPVTGSPNPDPSVSLLGDRPAHCDAKPSPDHIATVIGREIAQLYLVTFSRPADEAGFQFWYDKLAGGTSIDELRWAFAYSEEFSLKYLGMPDGEFVETMYTSVLCRVPDPDGASYWLGLLETGETRQSVYFYISRSEEFQIEGRL